MASKLTETTLDKTPAGGALVGASNGRNVAHNKGASGGLLKGRSHANGGIKAVNKSTGQPLEMEGNEVVITKNAVSDNTLHNFEGKQLTNRQILSRINESGGGVSFADGGEVPDTIRCRGKHYNYGGKIMTDTDIVSSCGCKHSMKAGGEVKENVADEVKTTIGRVHLTPQMEKLLFHFQISPDQPIVFSAKEFKELKPLQKIGLLYGTPDHDKTGHVKPGYMKVALMQPGKKFISDYRFPVDAKIASMDSDNREPEKEYTYFKGTSHNYSNPFLLNKAIEELLDSGLTEYTPEQKAFMQYYSGYGGLQKYGAEGKGLLYEYFTPDEIVKRMWGLAYKYGYKGGSICEPACGVGAFLKYAPENASIAGYEINQYSKTIAKILYPRADIKLASFETLFFNNRTSIRGKVDSLKKYDLVIGNPPYGDFEGEYAGMGEKKYTGAETYIDYFIFRSLDILKSEGLLIMIIGTAIGTPWIDKTITPVKREIMQKSELVDAYRLPNGVFDRTDVLTDIIVLRKK